MTSIPPPPAPLRVLLVLDSLGAGGTERSTAVLLPRLRDLGIDPVVALLHHREGGDEETVRAQGFDVRVLEARRPWARIRELRRLVRSLRPAVVHTAIFDADLAGRLAAAGTGVPVLSSLVNTPYVPERFDDPRVTAWKLRVLQLIDAITLASATAHVHAVTVGVAAHAHTALRVPLDRVTVVERGRDLEAFEAARAPERAEARAQTRADLGVGEGAVVLLAVGRVEYQKGFDDLVRAVARLRHAGVDVVAMIAGRPGNASADLEQVIAAEGVGEAVRLLGNRRDIPELLGAADVFVLPSRYEGTAGAAIEALAAGIPVVATDLEGTRDILVSGETALVVPVGDHEAFASAVAEVVREPLAATARAEAGRELVRRRFDQHAAARGMAELYGAVAAGPSRPPALPGRRVRRDVGMTRPARPGFLPGDTVEATDPALALSVIVCVHNEIATIGGTLEALTDQEWDRGWEFVLVDNDSDDGTTEVLEAFAATHPSARVVRAVEQRNLSYARNVGVAVARGRSVVFCDADDLPGPGFVAALGQALDEHPLVVPRLEYEALNGPLESGWSAFQGEGIERWFGLPIASGVSGWRRSLWIALGGDDEALDFSGEDTDLSLRAALAGIEPHFVGEAVYHYRRRSDVRATRRQSYRFGRAHVVLYERWGTRAGAHPDPLRVVVGEWWAIARGMVQPSRRSSRWWWRLGLRSGRIVESARRGVWFP